MILTFNYSWIENYRYLKKILWYVQHLKQKIKTSVRPYGKILYLLKTR
jgi:hypothetical protein